MKKFLAVLLTMLMLLGCTAALAEQEATAQALIIGLSDGVADSLIVVTSEGSKTRLLTIDPILLDLNDQGDPMNLMDAVNGIYGLNIDKYASLPFDNMAEAAATVGEIEINVIKSDLSVTLPDGTDAFTKTGKQKADGEQLAAYLAQRADDTKETLGARRRQVFESVINMAKTGDVTASASLIGTLMDMGDTNFELDELLQIAMAAIESGKPDIQVKVAPLTKKATGDAEAKAVREFLFN